MGGSARRVGVGWAGGPAGKPESGLRPGGVKGNEQRGLGGVISAPADTGERWKPLNTRQK